ncbi:MAG: intein-containing DNA gyrase subunit B [Candidatus Pacebacteria bacterium CG10_big_fil_rev_8_21_14_0_10_44_11]|nr:MAG: intein-containing DNA gyrase subunit B [Candidatus Pacebacteria bacterium CG10_big_fil_rev_8_21_14_0_10_44_11]
MPKSSANSYQASEIKILEGLEPVRKRPGMYIGSTDQRGLHHLAKEILDNAVDEAIAGFGQSIKLFYSPITEHDKSLVGVKPIGDEAITVVDNGRGIPVDMHSSGVSALEVVLTKLHAGGKFEETAYQASGGLHGVGSSAVNALSSLLQVVVKRNKKYYYQSYCQGDPQKKVTVIPETQVLELFPTQAVEFIKQETGTILKFVPDPTIFSITTFSKKVLKEVIKDRAYLMAGIYFQFYDEFDGVEEHFYFEGGVKSLVEHLNMDKKSLHEVAYVSNIWTDENTGKKIGVEVSMQYNDSYAERLESYVNVIRTPDGGAHVNGFRMALGKVLRDYAEKTGLIKEKESFTAEDIREGLAAVVFVKMPSNDLQFESQTKTKLNNSEAQSAVYQIFKDYLDGFLEEHPKAGKTIIEKVMLSARARLAARAAKEAVIRKGVFEGSSLPGKLADCQSRIAAESEIYIVEGDSAGGCFSGDTKIALADGRNISFKQLVKEQAKAKQNFCYTIRKNGKIGIEEIKNARITKKNTTVVKVTLDNQQEIVCTPDHQFMLRDGSYKEASQLKPTDSLMPLYKKLSDKTQTGITIDGYEMVWDPKSDYWLFTHMLADRYNLHHCIYTKIDGQNCHHQDFNKLNNNPTNILRLTHEEHFQLHRSLLSKTLHTPETKEKCRKLRKTAAFRKMMSERMRQPKTAAILSSHAKLQWANPEYKDFMLKAWKAFYFSNQEYQKQNAKNLVEAQKKYWSKPENRVKQSENVKNFFVKNPQAKKLLSYMSSAQWKNNDLLEWRREQTQKQWTSGFRKQRLLTLNKTYYKKTLSTLKKFEKNGSLDVSRFNDYRKEKNDKSILKFNTFLDRYFAGDNVLALEVVSHYNHKILKVEKCAERIDVYDIEVPNSHNFALASGVFVHNSAKQGRDRKFQAIFPLRGKILNTERARLDKIVDFEELKNLVVALGAGIGETFNPEKLRYHRIILMNDADVDGEHITTLGLTFFFRHLPEVVKQGYLYIAMPPLFKIATGSGKSGTEKYAYSDEERDKMTDEIKATNPKATIGIQRYKGLGEMNPEQLWETTMNPKTRILKRVTIAEADVADKTFSMLMGDEVAPRKKFIQTHAKLAELDV